MRGQRTYRQGSTAGPPPAGAPRCFRCGGPVLRGYRVLSGSVDGGESPFACSDCVVPGEFRRPIREGDYVQWVMEQLLATYAAGIRAYGEARDGLLCLRHEALASSTLDLGAARDVRKRLAAQEDDLREIESLYGRLSPSCTGYGKTLSEDRFSGLKSELAGMGFPAKEPARRQ